MTGAICLALQPGGGDFPGRCVKALGHDGTHKSAPNRGLAGDEWEADERDAA